MPLNLQYASFTPFNDGTILTGNGTTGALRNLTNQPTWPSILQQDPTFGNMNENLARAWMNLITIRNYHNDLGLDVKLPLLTQAITRLDEITATLGDTDVLPEGTISEILTDMESRIDALETLAAAINPADYGFVRHHIPAFIGEVSEVQTDGSFLYSLRLDPAVHRYAVVKRAFIKGDVGLFTPPSPQTTLRLSIIPTIPDWQGPRYWDIPIDAGDTEADHPDVSDLVVAPGSGFPTIWSSHDVPGFTFGYGPTDPVVSDLRVSIITAGNHTNLTLILDVDFYK